MLKNCPNCGKEFDAKGPNTKFCCPKCQRDFKKKEKQAVQTVFEKVCPTCGKTFSTVRKNKVYCCEACRMESLIKQPRDVSCLNCGKVFQVGKGKQLFCCSDCQQIYQSKQKFKDVEGAIICKECGMMGDNLLKHIAAKHGSVEEYCKKHNCTRDSLISEKTHKKLSDKQIRLIAEGFQCFTSENNPSKSQDCKDGRNSPYSMNFRKYDGLTDEEKIQIIEELHNKRKQTANDRCNNWKRIDYYTSRGYSEEEAARLLAESQSTFSLEKCIEKYGEEEGKKRWIARQEKWLKNFHKNVYSKVSQDLFNKITIQLPDRDDIYYATNNNGEYTLRTKDKYYKLDFYVDGLKKAIEFDGDFWHDQSNPKIKARDEKKTNDIINSGLKLLRVKEGEYYKNPEKVISECLEFLSA